MKKKEVDGGRCCNSIIRTYPFVPMMRQERLLKNGSSEDVGFDSRKRGVEVCPWQDEGG
jgi:hypothetical protein